MKTSTKPRVLNLVRIDRARSLVQAGAKAVLKHTPACAKASAGSHSKCFATSRVPVDGADHLECERFTAAFEPMPLGVCRRGSRGAL